MLLRLVLLGHGQPVFQGQLRVIREVVSDEKSFHHGLGRLWPLYVVAIPFVWSMIGTTAALSLAMPEDAGLFVPGLLGTALLVMKNRLLQSSLNA